MENRERILRLLNRKQPDRVPWFGDLDYWYSAARRAGTLPEKYEGDGYFQLNHDLGVGFYLQGFFPFTQHTTGITFSESRLENTITRVMHTPKGDLTEVQEYLPTSFSTGYVKHFVTTPDDLAAFQSYLESLEFTPDYAEAERRYGTIGDNGVVLCYTPRSPFMQMVTTYIGITNLVYLLIDAPDQMAQIFEIMEEKYDQAAELTVNSPAECIMIPENLSSEVVGARYYKKYLRPYENKWIQRIREAGKYSFIHMDGQLKGLISLVAETGFDVIEAATPLPSGDISMQEIIELVPGDTIIWGGMPGIMFTPLVSDADFDAHTQAVLALMRQEPRFVLGVADQVPPNGTLERVARVVEICQEFGRY
jgi:uroporphyrinogen-III decarboxylase